MRAQEQSDLQTLVATFTVTGLSQGDPTAGANLLASMACVLANLAPDDGSVTNRDGTPARLGTNLLVSGSSSAGRIVDEVITEVSRCQSTLTLNLQRYVDLIEQQVQKPGAPPPPTGPTSSAVEDVFAETQSDIAPLFGSRVDQWCRVLDERPPEQAGDLARRPKFLVRTEGR